jgi:hypothetical protein
MAQIPVARIYVLYMQISPVKVHDHNDFIFISKQSTNIQNGDSDVSHSTETTVDERTATAARTSGGRTEATATGATCSVAYASPEGACQYSERRCTSTSFASKYLLSPKVSGDNV